MKRSLIAVVCALLAVSLWSAPAKKASVKWLSDVPAAQKSLKNKKQSILLFFTAPGWCGPCRMLESGPVASAKFAKIVRENAAVKADYSDRRNVSEANKALLREFKVEGFPTLIVLDPQGKEKGRIVGYRPEKLFFAELEKLLK